MIEHSITFFEPETREECSSTDCEECHIMQRTIIGTTLPVCFNHAKSETYLGMEVI
jgi:hypothetical protein